MPDEATPLNKEALLRAIPEDELLHAMSPTLRSIADVSSPAAALALMLEYGGMRCHFPLHATKPTKLSRCVGDTAARQLIAEFAGTYLDVPRGTSLTELIVKHSSAPAPQIARALGRTERYIRNIRVRLRRQACAMPADAREAAGGTPLPENR